MGWHLHWKQAVMKKIIVLILIFFSICAGCFAQEAETDDVSAPETVLRQAQEPQNQKTQTTHLPLKKSLFRLNIRNGQKLNDSVNNTLTQNGQKFYTMHLKTQLITDFIYVRP